MTSTSPPAYPMEYYYPEFLDNRPTDPRTEPPKPPPLATSVTTHEPLNNRRKKPTKNLSIDVVTDQGLPERDITQASQTDPKKSLIRDPAEKNIPKLIVNDSIIKQAVHAPTMPVTNLDPLKTVEPKPMPNRQMTKDFSSRTKPIETTRRAPQQIVKMVEDEKPVNDYWKKEILIDDEGVVAIEPINYDKHAYEGPFGLTRKGSVIFYIGMSIFTLLAAVFLIMTGIFYSQSYPDSSSSTGELVGIGICAFSFYFGLLLILIAIWHQKRRQENPIKKVRKKSIVHHESTDHLKTSMEENQPYDYNYQPPMDYIPYGYYPNPPYASNFNEQMLLQQPGAATGAGYYDPVVWPTNVEVQTQPDSKFLQPMEWSIGPPPPPPQQQQQQQQSVANETTADRTRTPLSHRIKKSERKIFKPVEAQPTVGDFDNLQLNSTVIEQPLPVLSKAPETMELIQSLVHMEPTKDKSPTNSDLATKKTNRVTPVDTVTPESRSDTHSKKHKHHHHHRHRHNHRHRSPSPCSECDYYSHDYHHHHHQPPSVQFPRILTPRFPIILTPSPQKVSNTFYREAGINTGLETKIMRDSSTTANLEDIPNTVDNRLDRIPIVRRTVIVEPYPAQPSSQIIVKPQENLIGKINLSRNPILHDDNEVIVYPSTTYLTKKSKKKKKKKKKSTIVNDNVIEDLQLEDVNGDTDDDDDHYTFNLKPKSSQTVTSQTIKNAFYN